MVSDLPKKPEKEKPKQRKVKQNGNGSSNGKTDNKAAAAAALEATKTVFAGILDKAGVTDNKIGKRINEALDAKIIKVWYDRETGDVIESDPYTDHATRLKAAALAAQLKGHEPSKKIELDGNVEIQNLTDDELNVRISELLRTLGISQPVTGVGQEKKKT